MTDVDPDRLRSLPNLNTNYDPPKPWVCTSLTAHDCDGRVVGAIGANPVCDAGYNAERVARAADRERIAALMDTPEFRAAAAAEQAWEARVS